MVPSSWEANNARIARSLKGAPVIYRGMGMRLHRRADGSFFIIRYVEEDLVTYLSVSPQGEVRNLSKESFADGGDINVAVACFRQANRPEMADYVNSWPLRNPR